MQITEEQIKIRAFGEEMNQRARERFKPRETAQGIIDALPNQKIKLRLEK